MKNLRGKRLLILGGTRWINAIADFAEENGVEVFAASNDPKAKFFEIAKESFLISSTDAEAMKKLIREKKIDGVHVGSHEVVLKAACKYLHELGLPCYCTEEQLKILHNKENFKNACMSVGLPVVPQIEVDEQDLRKTAENLNYPLVVKPVDSSAARGVVVCKNAEEFLIAYNNARKFSSAGKAIAEKFVKNDGVFVHYTFSEGKVFFSGLSDIYTVNYVDHQSSLSGIHIFESPHTEKFCNLFEEKLEKLFDSLKIREGSLWIEVFKDGENWYFNEPGYRYAGSAFMYPIDYFHGINQLHSDLYYCLTGKSCIRGHHSLISRSSKGRKYYAIYIVHLKPGKIRKILGMEALRKRDDVTFVAQIKDEGDIVEDSGTDFQMFARIHFVFNSKSELGEKIDEIHKTLIVEDEHGKNLINRMLDFEKVADFFRGA